MFYTLTMFALQYKILHHAFLSLYNYLSFIPFPFSSMADISLYEKCLLPQYMMKCLKVLNLIV